MTTPQLLRLYALHEYFGVHPRELSVEMPYNVAQVSGFISEGEQICRMMNVDEQHLMAHTWAFGLKGFGCWKSAAIAKTCMVLRLVEPEILFAKLTKAGYSATEITEIFATSREQTHEPTRKP